MLELLQRRWQERVDQLTALRTRAVEEDRELTESESANSEVLRGEIDRLAKQIDEASALDQSIARTADVLRHLPVAANPMIRPGSGVTRVQDRPQDKVEILRSMWPTPGDYMHDVIHSQQGDREAAERIQRALANELTTDVPGLVPEPIVGDVINVIDASRPTVASLRMYAMPPYGSSFTRPKVVQHTQVGVQATQKSELPSRKFLVDPLTVTKQTVGGAIDVAFQVIDWTSPSALNAITNDLADEYAIQTEDMTCTLLETAAITTNAANIETISAVTDVVPSFFAAAGKVYAGSNRLPDTVWASVDAWVYLGGLADSDGRPLFPGIGTGGGGSITSFAGRPFMANLVVSPQFSTGTLIVGASQYAEVYEDRRGALRVVEPKLLGWEIAYYGYFAGLVTVPTAFVALDWTP